MIAILILLKKKEKSFKTFAIYRTVPDERREWLEFLCIYLTALGEGGRSKLCNGGGRLVLMFHLAPQKMEKREKLMRDRKNMQKFLEAEQSN